MGLKLKPVKCRSLSITSGKPTPISFTLDNSPLDTLDSSPHKFLGSNITFSGKQSETYKVIINYFHSCITNIDSLQIRNEYKLKIYKDYLLPASHFILTVHELTQTNLTCLDTHLNQYLKKWAGLPRLATPSVLHIDQFYAIKTVKELYEESHAVAYTSTRLKGDSLVNHAMDTKLDRESTWSSKASTMVQSSSILEVVTASSSSPLPLNKTKQLVKQHIHGSHQSLHWEHITELAMQGEYCHLWELQEADYTWKADLMNLPRGVAKFMVNAALNTLPTKDNLARWGKVISQACDRCGNRETMAHVLSGCPTALDQGRYTW